MARTDDDSWDITESVGATALGIAQARASESERECPLFTDPYARLFIDAATALGWSSPLNDETVAELQKSDPQLTERMQAMFGYAACRTKYFDEFFIGAGAAGIEQVVILAAGLDARAWRLPWVSGTVVYEIDQPKVLEFKSETLRANDAKPATKYVAVAIDLRQDWPKALRDAGFRPAEPTAWSAEGLLLYLPADAQDRLFERIQELSAGGSRIAVETFNSEFFDPERLDQRRARMQQMREAAAQGRPRDGRPGRAVVPRGARRRRGLAWRARLAGHRYPSPRADDPVPSRCARRHRRGHAAKHFRRRTARRLGRASLRRAETRPSR